MTYIRRAFHLTTGEFPYLLFRLVVTARIPNAGARAGKSEVDGSAPPFLLPGAGAGALRHSHLRNAPWEGRSRPNYPWREGQDEERGPGGPVPPDPPVAPETPRGSHCRQ